MTDLAIDTQRSASASPEPALHAESEALRRRLMRLAFDVHDGPMQSLTAIGYGLHDLHRRLSSRGTAGIERDLLADRLSTMIAELSIAETALRKLISKLEEGGAEIESLDVIVAEEISRFRGHCAAAIRHDVEPPEFRPDTHSQAIAIRSVMREALTNVSRHSRASNVRLRVQASPVGVLLEIIDDGHGFDTTAAPHGSIGLTSMRERVGLLGGTFDVLSKPGGPTVVTAVFARWRPVAVPPPAA
jgi:signal transduction histidine kinase